MSGLFGSLVYAILSLSHVLMTIGGLMLLLRRSAFRRNPLSREKWVYMTFSGFFLIVWLWNGIHPTPLLFAERAGLYWGIKTENIEWTIYTASDPSQSLFAYEGKTSLAVNFHQQKGWLIFHHYPNALPFDRYEAIEFHLLGNDLEEDRLIMALFSDGRVKHPSEDGLLLSDRHFCEDHNESTSWMCIRVPLSDFGHPGTGIIGVAIGKTDGQDRGTFFIDNLRLIVK